MKSTLIASAFASAALLVAAAQYDDVRAETVQSNDTVPGDPNNNSGDRPNDKSMPGDYNSPGTGGPTGNTGTTGPTGGQQPD